MALAAEGRNRDAVQELLAALRLDPNQPTWEFNVGSLLMRQGLSQDAAPHFSAALALEPGFDRARQALEASRQSRDRRKTTPALFPQEITPGLFTIGPS
jgi:Flp pilus assembly protein TadD